MVFVYFVGRGGRAEKHAKARSQCQVSASICTLIWGSGSHTELGTHETGWTAWSTSRDPVIFTPQCCSYRYIPTFCGHWWSNLRSSRLASLTLWAISPALYFYILQKSSLPPSYQVKYLSLQIELCCDSHAVNAVLWGSSGLRHPSAKSYHVWSSEWFLLYYYHYHFIPLSCSLRNSHNVFWSY